MQRDSKVGSTQYHDIIIHFAKKNYQFLPRLRSLKLCSLISVREIFDLLKPAFRFFRFTFGRFHHSWAWSDTCQIWMWSPTGNQCFDHSGKRGNWLCKSHPRTGLHYHLFTEYAVKMARFDLCMVYFVCYLFFRFHTYPLFDTVFDTLRLGWYQEIYKKKCFQIQSYTQAQFRVTVTALVQVMALHQTGAKPLSESTMTQFTHAYMHMHHHICICITIYAYASPGLNVLNFLLKNCNRS